MRTSTYLRVGDVSLRMALMFVLALTSLLLLASTSWAQSADDQYGEPVAPSGPAAEAQCEVSGDTDGIVNAGDTVTCGGDFNVSDGASVTLEDADATQGNFVDGENANITEGSLIIEVTGEPAIVAPGANGVLDTEGLFVVATTGVSAAGDDGAGADDGAADDGVADDGVADDGVTTEAGAGDSEEPSTGIGVLPDTGGFTLTWILGGAALVGAGLIFRRFSSRDR